MRRANLPTSALTTLQGCLREHPHQQPLSLVRQLLCCGQEGLTEGGEDSRDHQISPTTHTGLTHIPLLQEQDHQYHRGQHPPSTQTVLPPTIWQTLPQHTTRLRNSFFPQASTTQLTQDSTMNMSTPTSTRIFYFFLSMLLLHFHIAPYYHYIISWATSDFLLTGNVCMYVSTVLSVCVSYVYGNSVDAACTLCPPPPCALR